jgi:hypothetical protein
VKFMSSNLDDQAQDVKQTRQTLQNDLAGLSEQDFWPLVEQAKERVLTNDLDALERLVVDGLPPDEMQAAAWVLVQRVRGLRSDLARMERGRAAWQRELHALRGVVDPDA